MRERERERENATCFMIDILLYVHNVSKENDTCIGVGISFSQPWEKIRWGLIARKGTHMWYI